MMGGSRAICGATASCRRGRKNQSSTTPISVAGMEIQARKSITCINMCSWFLFFAPDLQYSQEGFLRDLHGADLLHALLARFLLFQQFALAAQVTAITLGEHVLAQRLDGGAGNDRAADGSLHG